MLVTSHQVSHSSKDCVPTSSTTSIQMSPTVSIQVRCWYHLINHIHPNQEMLVTTHQLSPPSQDTDYTSSNHVHPNPDTGTCTISPVSLSKLNTDANSSTRFIQIMILVPSQQVSLSKLDAGTTSPTASIQVKMLVPPHQPHDTSKFRCWYHLTTCLYPSSNYSTSSPNVFIQV